MFTHERHNRVLVGRIDGDRAYGSSLSRLSLADEVRRFLRTFNVGIGKRYRLYSGRARHIEGCR